MMIIGIRRRPRRHTIGTDADIIRRHNPIGTAEDIIRPIRRQPVIVKDGDTSSSTDF